MKHSPAFLFVLLFPLFSFSAEKLYLNPSSECGVFTTTRGEWATSTESEVKLGYDADYLYVDAFCKAAPGSSLAVAGKKDDDLSIFSGEVFEFQIAPPKQDGTYYHLAISPSGYLYSARKRDTQWNPKGLIRSTKTSGDEWKFHLAVPFLALGENAPAKGDVWKINLARTTVIPGKGTESSSLSGASDFHDVKQYADVVFGVKPPVPPLFLRGVSFSADGYSFRFDAPALLPKLKAELVLDGKTVFSEVVPVRNGELVFSGALKKEYLPLKAILSARVVLRNPETGAELFRKDSLVNLSGLDMLQLDRYYYTPQDKKIRYKQFFTGEKVTLRIRKDGRVRTIPGIGAEGAIHFVGPEPGKKAPPALSPGRYVLEVTAGDTRTSRVFFILDKPPVPLEIPDNAQLKITDKGLALGGAPVYLIGISGTPKAFLQFTPAFNLAYAKFGNQKNAVVLGGLPGAPLIRKPFTGIDYPPWDQHRKKIDAYLTAQDPAKPILHRIAYEAQIPAVWKQPDGTLVPRDTDELMARIYAHAKKAAPGLIYTIQTDNASKIEALSKSCDVFEVAFYSSSYAQNMVPRLRADMEKVVESVPRGKPVIFWLGGTIPNATCRLAEELRCGVYLSIAHGFSGNIFHMGHGFLPEDRSRVWSLISGIHAEVQRFYPAFARGKNAAGFVRKAPADSFVWKAVDTGDDILLLAVSTASSESMLEMKVDAKNVRLYDSSVETPLSDGVFQDLFTPYEPKVFVFRK
ncbi:MAG: hypothetical protein BWY31_00172 [Lentisphaerae bacterium ADurb.Bin242]|nr:MAG: hypothetical protein BWY31_00172 [Lentisphaerae bacterium ADurb.Bin242]